jgi:PKD repeat protein
VTIAGSRAYYQSGTVLVVADISDPAHPTKLGEFATGAGVGKPAVSGGMVYLPNNAAGFRILDATNPASITLLGEIPPGYWADQVVLSGPYALVGAGPVLVTVEVSNPASPQVKASYNLPASIESLLLSGNRLYVADNAGGLQILDVSDPLSVSKVGSASLPQPAKGVSVSGNYAYVTADTAGLFVFDISDPAHPAQVGVLDGLSYPYGIEVVPPYAYIADHWGLWVVDISDPAHPVDKVRTGTPGFAWDLAVSGNHAFIADYSDGIQVVDISNPLAPALVGSAPGFDWGESIVLNGRYAYVADDYQGLLTFDVLSPASPTLAFHNPAEGGGMYAHVVLQGTMAYVSGSNDGFLLYSLSNPAQPQFTGRVTGLYATESALSGNYAFVSASGAGLAVIDVSDPAHPTKVGGLDTPGNAVGVALSGNHAFVADGSNGLAVVDITNKAQPVSLGALPTSYQAVGAYSLGSLVYVGSWSAGLHIIDVANPSAPVEVGSLPIGSPQHFFVDGNRMFVGTRGNVVILDLTDPRNPTKIGEYDTPGFAFDAVASGNTVYVADGMEALAILEMKDCAPVCTLTCDPVATPTEGLPPLNVAFFANASATNCGGGPWFQWHFGDGSSSPEMNSTHTYAMPGTYTWTFEYTVDGQTCAKSGTIRVFEPTGILRGEVGIASGDEFFPLDAPSITGTVVLIDMGENVVDEVPISAGTFDFGTVPSGGYHLVAHVGYTDHVMYDASLLDFGCPAPSGHLLQKNVSSAPFDVTVQGGTTSARIPFPPPLVFLHGALECHDYWTSPASSDGWDQSARDSGFLSFTPNYAWWGSTFSWPGAADQVAQQVLQDLQGIHVPLPPFSGNGIPPWTLVAHDMGGLVARVMASGNHRFDTTIARLGLIYLLATPNSGSDLLLGGGNNSLLSVNSVIRRFNEVYPDFGDKTGAVYAIGGSADWWGSSSSDGPLPVPSAFTVTRLACSGESCIPYANLAFDSGPGHLFDHGHYDLGSPASADDVLRGIILRSDRALSEGAPESPAGSTIWGTGARTSGTAQGNVQGRAASQDFTFPIGATDGMAIAAWVTAGSAQFVVLDPGGQPAGASGPVPANYPGFLFTTLNPAPGSWTLRVVPGPSGATFSSAAVENSPFGVEGYLARTAFYPGEPAGVRLDTVGATDGVALSQVTATLFDLAGSVLQTVPLTPASGGYAGSLTAPATPGSYPVTFAASGTYLGQALSRTAYERLNVISSPTSRARLFSGSFADRPEDRDGSGKFDTVVLDASVALPSAGSFAFGADLYDGSSNWLAHASSTLTAQAPGTATASLAFPVTGVLCNQLASPLQVRNLIATDGASLSPLDLWTPSLPTQAYAAGSFDCLPSVLPPQPVPRTLRPDEGIRGGALDLTLAGVNLNPLATVTLGDGITVNGVTPLAENLLRVSISILPTAEPGPRVLYITNPGLPRVGLHDAFEVKSTSSPHSSIYSPYPGEEVMGTFTVNATASSELKITRVDFSVDGEVRHSDSDFPFTFPWSTTTVPDGSHTLSCVAYDESGQSGSSSTVSVHVRNSGVPGDCDGSGTVSIGEVQKAINMFLGIVPPGCGVDCNGNGTVSIGEVQKVINAFLGLTSSC